MATQRTSSARTSSGTGTKKTATKKATKKVGGQQAGAGKRGSQSPATSSDDPAHDGQHHDGAQDHDGAQRGGSAPRAAAQRRSKAAQVAQGVGQQLADLIGKEPEAVTGLERTEDGWRVQVEVVEVRRIPDTTDVLALYEVDVDEDGDLESYHRTRRYTRGAAGEG